MARERAASTLCHLAAPWLALAALEGALAALIAGGVLASSLPLAVRLQLISREWLALAGATLPLVAPLALACAILRRRGWRRLAGAVALAGATAASALLALSWASFHSTGQFPNREALTLMLASPLQLLQHVAHAEPLTVIALPLAALSSGLCLGLGLPALVARLGVRGRRAVLASAAALLLGACGLQQLDAVARIQQQSFLAHDALSGFSYHAADLYAELRDARSGPASCLWAELRDALQPPPDPLAAHVDAGLLVERRPLLPLDEYLARVDRAKLARWNVLVVIVESLRPDQLRRCGGARQVMPTVEAIAAAGTLYPRTWSQASHSNYADLCPLSGHYPLRSRRTHLYPPRPSYPRVLLHDLLQPLGWQTAVISSQNEDWGRMRNYLDTGRLDHFFDAESYDGPTRVPREDQDGGFSYFVRGPVKRSGKLDDRVTIDEAIRWTGAIEPATPFYIYLNLQNSHTPYEVPADFPRRFLKRPLGFEIRFNNYPPEAAEQVKDAYADSLAYVDSQLARLVAHLERLGRWRETLVVVTGDTGQAFYEHGFAAHANALYEEVMRVPLIIRAPGQAPAVDRRVAQHIDVAPSVLARLGLPPHPAHQGIDLAPPGARSERSLYLVAQCALAHQLAIVRDDLKLIYDERLRRSALFSLSADPGERAPIYDHDPRFGPIVERSGLLRRLATWRALQLDYYSDLDQQRRTYPPVLRD